MHHQHTLQHAATCYHTHCSFLPPVHDFLRSNTLQHAATSFNMRQHTLRDPDSFARHVTSTSFCPLQHAATCCNMLQHAATCCNTLQYTLRALDSDTPPAHDSLRVNTLQHTATHCNTLQHTATHCNTLQHTATHTTHPRFFCRIHH